MAVIFRSFRQGILSVAVWAVACLTVTASMPTWAAQGVGLIGLMYSEGYGNVYAVLPVQSPEPVLSFALDDIKFEHVGKAPHLTYMIPDHVTPSRALMRIGHGTYAFASTAVGYDHTHPWRARSSLHYT